MASLLRSGSVSKIFSSLRRVLTSEPLRHEALTPHRPLHGPAPALCPALTRLLSAQRHAESASTSPTPTQSIDRALYRIDTDIRRTGRIYLRDVEEIFNEVKNLRHASSTQSMLLLRCCGSLVPEEQPEVRNKLVQDIWNTLQDIGVALDISHYNTLLRVYLENNHKFSPTEFLAMLERNGVEPNRVTFQRLIARYCQEGDLEGATKILEFMKEKQLPAGENIFNALITGHARANDLDSAWSVLDVMRSSGLEPTSDSYAALMVAHAEVGDGEGLQRTFEACEAAEAALHDRDLLEVIFTLAAHDHHDLIPQVLDRLRHQQGYTHDAMNVIYRLVNAGCHEVAHQLLSTLRVPQAAEGQPTSWGSFFINHLVKSGTTPMTRVVHYCQELKEKGINPLALETALNSALVNGRHEEALFLMRVMRDEGYELRTHYFWPILLHHSNNGNTQKVYSTVQEMKKLGTPLTQETLRHYVIPGLAAQGLLDADGFIAGLKEAGTAVPFAVNGLVAFLLDTNDSMGAAKLLSRYRVKVWRSQRRDLVNCYLKSHSASPKAVVAILGRIEGVRQASGTTEREDGTVAQEDAGEDGDSIPREEQQQDIPAMFILDVAHQCKRSNMSEKLLPLLQEMEQQGIGISTAGRDTIRAKLPFEVDTATEAALERLCSEDLVFQPFSQENREPYIQRSVKDLEQRILELQNKNLPTTGVESYLLMAYIKAKEVEKAEALKQRMEAEGLPMGMGSSVLLVDMYVGMGELKKALAILEKLMAQEPEVKLTPPKYLRLALLMAQEGMAKDVVPLIEQHVTHWDNSGSSEDSRWVPYHARRLVDQLVEQSDLELARHVLDLLFAHKVVAPCSPLFNAFIKYHLAKDDLESALAEFESISQTHRITPFKQEIITRCITLEDGDKLQKIMDLSIQAHGELNSLYDMVFAFIECGKVHQARKLIETPGLRAFNDKLDQKCRWLRETGRVEKLANLVSVTKEVFDIDHAMMYSHLLKAYVQQNDPDKALGVWITMQEDNHHPSDDFLIELGEFLQSCGRQVPFEVPKKQPPAPQQEPAGGMEELPRAQYRRALKDEDWLSALNNKKQVEESGGKVNINQSSQLVEGLVRNGRLEEAADVVLSMLAAGAYPVVRVFRYFLLALANTGRVEQMQALQRYMTDLKMKRRLTFDTLMCTAYTTAGQSQEMLDMLSTAIRDTPDTDLQELGNSFPRGGIMGILEKHPHHFPQVLEIAEQYAARGLLGPINCVWMHLFAEGHKDQADQIYQKHLTTYNRLMFRGILKQARRTQDVARLPSLMQVLEGHPGISSQAKGFVYSSWIDILNEGKKFEEGKEVLDAALKTISLTDIGHRSVSHLKAGLQQAGKEFPYTIPPMNKRERRRAADGSSSSSDTD